MSSGPADSFPDDAEDVQDVQDVQIGLRERKKRRMREQLKSTALSEFAARGYERVTVEEIAHTCDVSPRTFYRYFPTKEHVLLEQSALQMDVVALALRARPADESPAQALQRALLAAAALGADTRFHALDHLRILRTVPAVLHTIQARSVHSATTALAERMGVPGADLEARVIASALMAANRVALTAWLDSDGRVPLVDLVEEAFEALPDPYPCLP
jgi:AcrR family transcriptional regulator